MARGAASYLVHKLFLSLCFYVCLCKVENVPATILPPRVLDSLNVESMADIFFYLDVDGSGQLTQMEFVEGLLNLCLLDWNETSDLTRTPEVLHYRLPKSPKLVWLIMQMTFLRHTSHWLLYHCHSHLNHFISVCLQEVG